MVWLRAVRSEPILTLPRSQPFPLHGYECKHGVNALRCRDRITPGARTTGDKRMKLGQALDPRNNALNALRLAMAAEVILWHFFAVTGRVPPSAPVRQLLFGVGSDGFFAISGFLITRSWINNPRVRDYLVARALRILPGLYVCLVVTALSSRRSA